MTYHHVLVQMSGKFFLFTKVCINVLFAYACEICIFSKIVLLKMWFYLLCCVPSSLHSTCLFLDWIEVRILNSAKIHHVYDCSACIRATWSGFRQSLYRLVVPCRWHHHCDRNQTLYKMNRCLRYLVMSLAKRCVYLNNNF